MRDKETGKAPSFGSEQTTVSGGNEASLFYFQFRQLNSSSRNLLHPVQWSGKISTKDSVSTKTGRTV